MRTAGNKRQRLLSLILLLVLLMGNLAACSSSNEEVIVFETLDERAARYEASLRAELTWLWDNRLYIESHLRPTAERCTAPDFTRDPVTMDGEARAKDDLGGKIVDNLAYAARLIDEARAKWADFCAGQVNAATATAFMGARLEAAGNSLNLAREWLDARARSRQRAGQ